MIYIVLLVASFRFSLTCLFYLTGRVIGKIQDYKTWADLPLNITFRVTNSCTTLKLYNAQKREIVDSQPTSVSASSEDNCVENVTFTETFSVLNNLAYVIINMTVWSIGLNNAPLKNFTVLVQGMV